MPDDGDVATLLEEQKAFEAKVRSGEGKPSAAVRTTRPKTKQDAPDDTGPQASQRRVAHATPAPSSLVGDVIEHDSSSDESDGDAGEGSGFPKAPHPPFPIAQRRRDEPRNDNRAASSGVATNDIDAENRAAIEQMGDAGVEQALAELAKVLPQAKLDFLRKRGAAKLEGDEQPAATSRPLPPPPPPPPPHSSSTDPSSALYSPTDAPALLRFSLGGEPASAADAKSASDVALADAAAAARGFVAGSADITTDDARPLREWASLCGSAARPQRVAALRALTRALTHLDDEGLKFAATATRRGGAGVPFAAAAAPARCAAAGSGAGAEAVLALALVDAWAACAHRLAHGSTAHSSAPPSWAPLRRTKPGERWTSAWDVSPSTYAFLLDPMALEQPSSPHTWPELHWSSLGLFAFPEDCAAAHPRALQLLGAVVAVAPKAARRTLVAHLFAPVLPAGRKTEPRMAMLGLEPGLPHGVEAPCAALRVAIDVVTAATGGAGLRVACAVLHNSLRFLPEPTSNARAGVVEAWALALRLWTLLIAAADRPGVLADADAVASLGRLPTFDEYFPRLAGQLQPPLAPTTDRNFAIASAAFDLAATFSTATRVVLLTPQCNAALARHALGWVAAPEATNTMTAGMDDADVAALVYLAEHVSLGATGGCASAPGATPGVSPQALRHAAIEHALPRARAAVALSAPGDAGLIRALRRATATLLALTASGAVATAADGGNVPTGEVAARALVYESVSLSHRCVTSWKEHGMANAFSRSGAAFDVDATTAACAHLLVVAARAATPLLGALPDDSPRDLGDMLRTALAALVAYIVPPGHDLLAAAAAAALGSMAAHAAGTQGAAPMAEAALRHCVIPKAKARDDDDDDGKDGVVVDDDDDDYGNEGDLPFVSASAVRLVFPWREREGSRVPLGDGWVLYSLAEVQGDPTGQAPPTSVETCAPILDVLASLCRQLCASGAGEVGTHAYLRMLCRAIGHPGGAAAAALALTDGGLWDGRALPWLRAHDDSAGDVALLLDEASDAAFATKDGHGLHPLGSDPSVWEPLVARLADAAFGRAFSLARMLGRALLPRDGDKDEASQAAILRALTTADALALLPSLDAGGEDNVSWVQAFFASDACVLVARTVAEAPGCTVPLEDRLLPAACVDVLPRLGGVPLPPGMGAAVIAGGVASLLGAGAPNGVRRLAARRILVDAPLALAVVATTLAGDDGRAALASCIGSDADDHDLRARLAEVEAVRSNM